MYLITSLSITFIVYKWPQNGIIIAIVISLIMEYFNVLWTAIVKKRIEKNLDEKFKKTTMELKLKQEEEYKRAEMYKDESEKWKKLFDRKN